MTRTNSIANLYHPNYTTFELIVITIYVEFAVPTRTTRFLALIPDLLSSTQYINQSKPSLFPIGERFGFVFYILLLL